MKAATALLLAGIAFLAIAIERAHRDDLLIDSAEAPVAQLQAAPIAPAAAKPVQHSGVLQSANSFREIIPPTRFQGDTAAVILFGHADFVGTQCAAPDMAAGTAPLACAGVLKDGVTPVVIAPNPCIFAPADLYAAILCHEVGHLNGWPRKHGD